VSFGSQRALGQDLATHPRTDVSGWGWRRYGAAARDLHGALPNGRRRHMLTHAPPLTAFDKPRPATGAAQREQYLEYIDRTEQRPGQQPRAVVFTSRRTGRGSPGALSRSGRASTWNLARPATLPSTM
jgi:hypothetical protein